ncbi:tetratricopeptide repeat protein [Pseudomonas chlororaphis]|uniref:tetratricopeptide repeat protein n=1 Tax=Pseudomonas chlororaphis TaxID=587753 RepID=UPI002368CBE5|nr:tetratricopeptide repeat protein [Pseudomonas chlororaphis]WDG81387.1 tetratricopeptide repeat protein [Pseudomonas chlororaphis]WDG85560.1 tetratricopeptide repeat protein [Pseudomonas chlororaphis]
MADEFKCVHETDVAPPLDKQADQFFEQARTISKERLPDWAKVADLYQKSVEKNHWKAMHNLAELYLRGDGVPKNTNKAIDLYMRMVELEVPLGYYDMSVMVQRGVGVVQSDKSAMQYLIKAANLGNPQALTHIGYIYIYEKNNDQLGLKLLKCADRQSYADASYKIASYNSNIDKNYPVAMYYYQRATALGMRKAALVIESTFADGDFGYKKDEKIALAYSNISSQLYKKTDLRFPDLAKEHPLPPHPIQGYHADKDINWKPTGRDDDY